MIKLKKYRVIVRQTLTLPFRKVSESLDREYTIRAKTIKGAKKAIRDAGIKGRIIDIKVVGVQG